MRRLGIFTDNNGEQFDQDFFTYSFVPNATSITGGISGTLAPGATATINVNIEQDSAFEWVYSTFNASINGGDTSAGKSANISIQIQDTAAGKNLFNEPLPAGLVAGTGNFAYVLPFARRFMPAGTIIMSMTNYDTAITFKNIQFNMIGRKIYTKPGGKRIQRFQSWRDPDTGRLMAQDFFAYHWGFGSLVPAATQQVSQLIENDSDFEARLQSASNNATLTSGSATDLQAQSQFSLLDGGSQRYLSNVPILGIDYAGNGGVPLILPTPRIFLARTNVTYSLTNNSAATTIAQTDIVLAGRKIFEISEGGQ